MQTQFTPEDIIKLLHELERPDFPFDTALKVKLTPHRDLMEIWGVSVDANNRLWVRTSRRDEIQVDNTLIYSQYILGSLNQRLKGLIFFQKELAK